ncbi:MAG: hypothetical protein A2806_00465 [Candidatus Terrybacteria bacterium RIFCSPHIGHO2_01_FULL_48_17]|uniref:methionine adenosyltransferase n=1 Tax=Candidatus Terrybacteria bacterium RIFCSPHIGHO2_01_FULL_48_17 TaxID=1802362 RepID=A0A1G2PJZ8_9BACT|nr:MAG: hypothetical protein A2806_00465 [Candidatus Terrybacteria bacterium RIFCSPHIGHO2_01_FULL_48_17]OHA53684.1 MAG: hypothetical protein A3A30_00785 [Candidatus Terrybacteria bacterium RIFCSPLOWO2_01_FULL_48_14]
MRTAEYIRIGHPDKVCDLMADAVLDAYLDQDPTSRVAVEVMGGHGKVFVVGEVTSAAHIDVPSLVAQTYKDIGYNDSLQIAVNIVSQSPDIAAGVDIGGAGDQGITVGYATPETPEMLPKELVLARRICSGLDDASRTTAAYLGPDGKAQVTLDDKGNATTVVASAQHAHDADPRLVYDTIADIVHAAVGEGTYQLLINPTGIFTFGGFLADSGATGRKIVCDQYGPRVRIGGGSFSGKDPTKVDRSGAYFARWRARRIAKKTGVEALVEYAWAIGSPKPLAAVGDTDELPTVAGMITQLDLRRPIYYNATMKGHYGSPDLPWEQD